MFTKINLNESEAAEQYGLSVHWFRRARWAGGGPPYIKLKGRVLYRREDLDRFFQAKLRLSTSDTGH